MKLLLLAFLSLVSFFFLSGSKAPPYQPIDEALTLHWEISIGRASFRSNISTYKDLLIIGSNGNEFRDGSFMDLNSGVYFINSRTGKIEKSISKERWGDFDVNGTIIYNGYVYFGNDNEEFVCVDMKGNIIWKNLASGDIEAEPVLIDIKGKKASVYATELGEVKAVDPTTGKSFWSYFTPGFSGWKEGDSRPIFKVKAFLSSTESFFTKPVLADVNKDGVSDIIYSCLYNNVVCISGNSGKLLWDLKETDTYYSYSIDYKKIGNSTEFWLATSTYNREAEKSFLSITRINERGEIIENNRVKSAIYIGDTFHVKSTWDNEVRIINRVYHDQLFSSSSFNYKGNDSCIALLSQYDRANYENGFITIISLKSQKVIARLALPDISEMPPQVGDFNKDGKTDLLINCADGKLYCYQLN